MLPTSLYTILPNSDWLKTSNILFLRIFRTSDKPRFPLNTLITTRYQYALPATLPPSCTAARVESVAIIILWLFAGGLVLHTQSRFFFFFFYIDFYTFHLRNMMNTYFVPTTLPSRTPERTRTTFTTDNKTRGVFIFTNHWLFAKFSRNIFNCLYDTPTMNFTKRQHIVLFTNNANPSNRPHLVQITAAYRALFILCFADDPHSKYNLIFDNTIVPETSCFVSFYSVRSYTYR